MRYITSMKLSLKKNYPCMQSFVDKVSLSKLDENQTIKCEGAITELLKI